MPGSARTLPRDVAAAASAWDHDSAVWHAQQVLYWRGQAGHGVVPAGRCAFHVQRHERRVQEIADRSLESLASDAQFSGAAA